jgi:hypothetical protein
MAMMYGRTSTRLALPPRHAHADETSETAACHCSQDGKIYGYRDVHVQLHHRAHQLSFLDRA